MPRLGAPNVVCVLTHYGGSVKALVLPSRIDYTDLVSAVRFQLDSDVNQVRLPPALHARRIVAPEALLCLRDGDLLDVLTSRSHHMLTVRQADMLKDCVLWTRNFVLGASVAVRLWFPHIRGPLLTSWETV